MKPFALLTGLVATTLAAPLGSDATSALDARTFLSCPANSAQPDGKLPPGAISTSLLLPISKNQPNKAFSATDVAIVTPNDFCTIFNLELPVAATQNKVCNLVFDFPDLLGAPGLFTYLGLGDFTFTGYAINAGAVAGNTTYNNQPAPGPSPPTPPPKLQPGHSYIINSAPCGIPDYIPGSVTVSGSLCSKDTALTFKQSNELCPLGFYVILTDI